MNRKWCLLVVSATFCLRLAAAAAVWQENFSVDPSANGWKVYGDGTLFHWNATNQNLEATWDSSRPSSYFYHPLGTILAIDDEFSLEFDLQLRDATATGAFELAVGLLNFSSATNRNFSRANAVAPNLFEFDYFPDGGFGASIDATLSDMSVSSTNTSDYYFAYDTVPLDLGTVYHVTLTHAAHAASISGMVMTNGHTYTALPQVFPGPITDFRLDTISISSYTSTDDTFGDSLVAHGVVDNLLVTVPPSPIQNLEGGFSNSRWQVQFTARSNWVYSLERTTDQQSWSSVSPEIAGIGGTLTLTDTTLPLPSAFYRVRARKL